jgi:phage baseplate assembly protein W
MPVPTTTPTVLRTIAYPFRVGSQAFPMMLQGLEDVVFNSIKALMATSVGERVMRGALGTNVQAFIFDTLDPLTQARVAAVTARAIALYEPRAEVLSVEARQGAAVGLEDTAIVLDVVYRINNQVYQQQIPIQSAPAGSGP